MRIVALSHEYVPNWCAGSETMLHRLLSTLAARGHQVEVWLPPEASAKPSWFEGVRIRRARDKADPAGRIQSWAQVVIANAHQELLRAKLLAQQQQIPCVALMHNEMDPTREHVTSYGIPDLLVYAAAWTRKRVGLPGMVVRPTVNPADYATTPGQCVTLVNLFEIKGPEILWALAKRMPQQRFLAVKGAYGDQQVKRLRNVDVLDHVPHANVRDRVLARTRVLLMPSQYETWGRIGSEAMSAGIPVVASDLPGLRESLGFAGTFVKPRTRIDLWEQQLRHVLDPDVWLDKSRQAKIRAAEIGRTDDVARFCAAVEALDSADDAKVVPA